MDRYDFLSSRIPAFAGLVDDHARAQAAWLEAILGPPKATVLDAGCGGGRHSVLLAARGYDVTGVDASAPALAIARDQAAEHGVDPTFVHGDLREPAGPFDAVLFMDVTLGVFDDAEATEVLRGVRARLNPGGTAVIELYHRPFWRSRLGTVTTEPGVVHPTLGVRRTYREDGDWLVDEVTLVGDDDEVRAPDQWLRLWSVEQAIAQVAGSGLKPVDLFGPRGFTYGPTPEPLAHDAAFLWVVAKR